MKTVNTNLLHSIKISALVTSCSYEGVGTYINSTAQSAGAVELTDCISAEE